MFSYISKNIALSASSQRAPACPSYKSFFFFFFFKLKRVYRVGRMILTEGKAK
jgi:hypothetical protein